MKFAIIGAGGIGCYYAARLIQSGEEVTLVARGAHLKAMQTQGLEVQHSELKFNQVVNALSLDEWLKVTKPEDLDVIIVCLKGMQTAEFASQLNAWLKQFPQSKAPYVLSLQNGVDNEQQLSSVLPAGIVLGGIARRIGAHIIKPGVIESIGPAQVILGLWPNHQKIAKDVEEKIGAIAHRFNTADIPTEISTDINKELWRKLIVNNGLNPICTLLEKETGQVTSDTRLLPLIRGAMEESVLAAKANGVELSKQDLEDMLELISTFDSIKPSMLVDREKGRPLEIEEICGVVIKGCEKLGKDAPYNRTISTLLRVAVESP